MKKKNIANIILYGLAGVSVIAMTVTAVIQQRDMPKPVPEMTIEKATDIIVTDDVLIKAQNERIDNLIYLIVMLGDVVESSNLDLGKKNIKALEKMEKRDRELLQLITEYKHSREELIGEDRNVLDKQGNKR